VYRFIVKQIVRRTYRRLSEGEWEAVTGIFAPDAVFRMSGTHPLGGERRGAEAIRGWFEQSFTTFPGLQLEPIEVVVGGWPWNTRVTVRFTVRWRRPDGSMYENEGMQFLRLRWGRAVEDYLYEDTQALAAELERVGAGGHPGAASAA
jgi:ketosteroid isomerase-like protein